jgi:hypothetical protein
LPCKEETIRGYAHVDLLVLEEAARVPDDLDRAVGPMLALSKGRLICLSTPHGPRGFFHDAWVNGGEDWKRIEVPGAKVPRISAGFLEEERRAMGESWFRQEYCCAFEAFEGLVYPDFGRCVVAGPAPREGRKVGGMDFGFRNPFAVVWGLVDGDGVLWLTGEHYQRQKPPSHHMTRLPREATWYAGPSGANERSELRCAGFAVREGSNAIRPGIAAVSAWLENETLRVVRGACPSRVAEAQPYRYAEEGGEEPEDEHNRALAALRYLVTGLDGGRGPWRPRPPAPPRPQVPQMPWWRWTTRGCGRSWGRPSLECGDESPLFLSFLFRPSPCMRARAKSGDESPHSRFASSFASCPHLRCNSHRPCCQ